MYVVSVEIARQYKLFLTYVTCMWLFFRINETKCVLSLTACVNCLLYICMQFLSRMNGMEFLETDSLNKLFLAYVTCFFFFFFFSVFFFFFFFLQNERRSMP